MLVLEFKTYGKTTQIEAVKQAIRTTQFIRNKAIRLWIDGQAKSWIELSRHCALLAKEFPFANNLNSMARQAAAERAWSAISKFYDNFDILPDLKVRGFFWSHLREFLVQ